MLREDFEPGTIVKHFKRDMFNAKDSLYLYAVIGTVTEEYRVKKFRGEV